MTGLLLLGCTGDIDAGKLAGTTVTEAWIDDFAWLSFTFMGGGLHGGGTLRAVTTEGQTVRQPVSFGGGVGGLAIFMEGGTSGRVDYTLPETQVPGEWLFGAFDGSLESIAVVGGYQSMHLRSENLVQLDSEGFALFIGIGVAAVGIELRAVDEAPPAGTLDTGMGRDSGDTADSGDSGDSGESGDSGDSGA